MVVVGAQRVAPLTAGRGAGGLPVYSLPAGVFAFANPSDLAVSSREK